MPPAFCKKRRAAVFACAALTSTLTLRAWAQNDGVDPAVARIRAFYAALLAAMRDAERLGVRGRYDKLAPTVRDTFDLAAMTRIAIGPDWSAIAAEQQAPLIANFSRMTIATYANRFDGYVGERFEVEPAPDVRATGRVVRTRIVPGSGEPVILNYLMRGAGNDWKVIDVYLTGTISELAARRSEFGAILKSGGPGALIQSLQQQADRLLRGPGTAADSGKR